MKWLKYFACMVAALLLLGGGYFAQKVYRLDLRWNSVSGSILRQAEGRAWGSRVALTPTPFSFGDAQKNVEERLENEGFSPDSSSHILAMFPDDTAKGRTIYMREASTMVCKCPS